MFLDLLFPNHCLGCGVIIPNEEIVCPTCKDKIHFTHFGFYDRNPLKQKCEILFPVEDAFALMYFEKESLSQKLMHQLKYNGMQKIGKILAQWTTEYLQFGEDKPNIITNIPLHPKKQKKRGYNQLHLFTEEISKFYDIPYDHHLLKRNIHTTSQARKDKILRQENQSIFTLQKSIRNQHILLIDDVITTGNTLSTATWELLKHQNKVSILVMAIDI